MLAEWIKLNQDFSFVFLLILGITSDILSLRDAKRRSDTTRAMFKICFCCLGLLPVLLCILV